MTYQEEYGYFDAAEIPRMRSTRTALRSMRELDYMSLYQESKIDGSGVDQTGCHRTPRGRPAWWVWRSIRRPTTGSTAVTVPTSNRT